jgi:hypothetical protein
MWQRNGSTADPAASTYSNRQPQGGQKRHQGVQHPSSTGSGAVQTAALMVTTAPSSEGGLALSTLRIPADQQQSLRRYRAAAVHCGFCATQSFADCHVIVMSPP